MDETDPSLVPADTFRLQETPSAKPSTAPDDAITNQQLNKIALDMGSQSDDMVTALNAIASAINAKPSA